MVTGFAQARLVMDAAFFLRAAFFLLPLLLLRRNRLRIDFTLRQLVQ
jgi:hypothetical protein